MGTKALKLFWDGCALPIFQLFYNIRAFVILVGFGKHGRDNFIELLFEFVNEWIGLIFLFPPLLL